jgi:Domain of unknown function (DUF4136)
VEIMNIRTLAAVAVLSMGGGIAFAQDVNVDYDKSADFSKIKTFAVKLGTSWGNPLSEKRVTNEIQQALVGKGWTAADADKADAIVVLHGATEKQKELNTFYSGGGGMYGGYGWRGMGGAGMGMGTSTTTASEYTVGTLVVDIFDAKSKQLLFRGTATDELSEKPEKNQKKLAKASDKMFKNFPPGSAPKK